MDEVSVKFPAPCDEKWDAMAPRGCHRHCVSCDKVIHDLEQMTGEEAVSLLQSDQEACVRAKVDAKGFVRVADSGRTGSPKLRTAAVSAAAGLALAACSTTPIGTVTARYTLSGSLQNYFGTFDVRIEGNGIEKTRKVGGQGDYRFRNLKAGIYRVHVTGSCIEDQVVEVSITDDDLKVEPIRPVDGIEGCIIVGKMEPADQPQRA